MTIDYSKGQIYKLCIEDLTYVGSTCQKLSIRKGGHKKHYNRWIKNKDTNNYVSSFKLFEKGNPDIILIENYPCKNKNELHKREREWIEKLDCVNIKIPTRTIKQFYEDNKETFKDKQKEYYRNNIEKIKLTTKQFYENNADKIKQKQREYYKLNSDIKKEYMKKYYNDNIDKIRKYRHTDIYKNYRKVKYFCVCGSEIRKSDKAKHEKTQKHNNFINSK